MAFAFSIGEVLILGLLLVVIIQHSRVLHKLNNKEK